MLLTSLEKRINLASGQFFPILTTSKKHVYQQKGERRTRVHHASCVRQGAKPRDTIVLPTKKICKEFVGQLLVPVVLYFASPR